MYKMYNLHNYTTLDCTYRLCLIIQYICIINPHCEWYTHIMANKLIKRGMYTCTDDE